VCESGCTRSRRLAADGQTDRLADVPMEPDATPLAAAPAKVTEHMDGAEELVEARFDNGFVCVCRLEKSNHQ
jgi:hypothetical protein